MEDVNKRRRNFFLFLTLTAVPKKSPPGKFAYVRHFHRIGINLTKPFEKTFIHFESDVFAAVAFVHAKAQKRALWFYDTQVKISLMFFSLSRTSSSTLLRLLRRLWRNSTKTAKTGEWRPDKQAQGSFVNSHPNQPIWTWLSAVRQILCTNQICTRTTSETGSCGELT